jgi:hypothetical protein
MAAPSAFNVWDTSVSKAVKIDPRVLSAWSASEGAPGNQPGYYNYLNIQTATATSLGIPTAGTGPAGTAIFGSIGTGITAAIREINSLGIGGMGANTPRTQIGAIAASPWASSHYGGPGGPNLLATFSGMFGSAALDKPPIAASGQSYGNPGVQQVIPGPQSPSNLPGVAAVQGAISSVTSVAGFLGKLTDPNLWIRILEIVGGAVISLAGLYLLVRNVGLGVSVPTPGPTSRVAEAAPAV